MGSECLTIWPIQGNVLIAPDGASIFLSPSIRKFDHKFTYSGLSAEQADELI